MSIYALGVCPYWDKANYIRPVSILKPLPLISDDHAIVDSCMSPSSFRHHLTDK